MSEFDKEAEREKLRKKFAKDDEKRQSTKRMSELLLKGATMTNSHCNQCGDPVFRFDGQEFCPSCQDATVAGGQIQLRNPEGRQQESESTQPAQTAQATQATQATGQRQSVADSEPAAAEPTAEATEASATESAAQATEVDVEPTQPPVPATESSESAASAASTESAESTVSAPQSRTTGNADLDAARASLRRTVTRYAEEAEQTDDPRRARELLSAAREAAETLAALRR